MPTREVYICDKTEGLKGEHRRCGREVGSDGIRLTLTLMGIQEELPPAVKAGEGIWDLQFCSRRHAQYWLIRQRL